jgi:hypothetical protein
MIKSFQNKKRWPHQQPRLPAVKITTEFFTSIKFTQIRQPILKKTCDPRKEKKKNFQEVGQNYVYFLARKNVKTAMWKNQ